MTTPIRQQYLRIKRDYPDAILLFRMGDFYETFDEDAKIAARELEITLTSKPLGKGLRVPLAGIPYHAVDSYLARLISKGYKVAICEQLEDPARAKGLVDRGVIRLVTPGTLIEPQLLDARSNNYLAALITDAKEAGLAYADVSTGEFATTQLPLGRLPSELERLQPAEVLVPKEGRSTATGAPSVAPLKTAGSGPAVTEWEEWRFDPTVAREALQQHFEVASLEGFGCAHLPLALAAAGAVLQYLQETQKGAVSQITRLTTYSTEAFMALDAQTRRNLELVEGGRGGPKTSLLSVLDATKTPMGGRLLRRWLNQPLVELAALQERQSYVRALHEEGLRRLALRELLGKGADLERLIGRVAGGSATPRDLVALRRSLALLPELRASLLDAPSSEPLQRLATELHPCDEVVALIEQALVDDPPATLVEGGAIKAGFSEELDGLRLASKSAKQYLAGLEKRERERTNIKSLKVGYNRVFGYYIEVSKTNLDQVPPDYIRKQTLVNGERYITPELKEYESIILNAQDRLVELEQELFKRVCAQVSASRERIQGNAASLARLDVACALAEVAVRQGYVAPELDEGDDIVIKEGRHPVVELARPEEPFIPNDCSLSNTDQQIIVLTGPNMAGKSTYLRQVALIVLLAQIGSFVPARQARIGLVDRIFTRVGAQDDLAAGQSTFLVEMLETANILNHATLRSLIILDEIGRGTSTYDGLAIARAVVEHLHNDPRLGAKTLFATHYHELTDLAGVLPRVRNYTTAVAEEAGRVVFLHKIIPGGADRSYGIHVAQLAGLPRSIINRASEVLEELEQGSPNGVLPSAQRRSFRPQGGKGRSDPGRQLPLFGAPSPLVEELLGLDISSLTPLEALNKLYELQQKARGETK